MNIADAQVYVQGKSRKKPGKWLFLKSYKTQEAFDKACARITGGDTPVFENWHNIPEGLISREALHESLIALSGYLGIYGREKQSALSAYFADEYAGKQEVSRFIVNLPQLSRDYIGTFETAGSFCFHRLKKSGLKNPGEFIACFDADRYVRGLEQSGDLKVMDKRHYFDNGTENVL